MQGLFLSPSLLKGGGRWGESWSSLGNRGERSQVFVGPIAYTRFILIIIPKEKSEIQISFEYI